MKVSIAGVKAKLSVGTEFVGEFIGVNAQICRPGLQKTRRRVTKNNTELVSTFLDGPRVGEAIYLTWRGLTADETDGAIVLSMHDNGAAEPFLRITF